jgi:hypothetical protein
MVAGIGFVALVTAAAADYFIRRGVRAEVKPAEADLQGQLDSLSDRLRAIEALLSTMIEQHTVEEAERAGSRRPEA